MPYKKSPEYLRYNYSSITIKTILNEKAYKINDPFFPVPDKI